MTINIKETQLLPTEANPATNNSNEYHLEGEDSRDTNAIDTTHATPPTLKCLSYWEVQSLLEHHRQVGLQSMEFFIGVSNYVPPQEPTTATEFPINHHTPPHQRWVLWTDRPQAHIRSNIPSGMIGMLYVVDDDTKTFARVRVDSMEFNDNANVRAIMSSMSQADQDRLVQYVEKWECRYSVCFLVFLIIYLLLVYGPWS
jgi:hypothetical protein